MSGNRAEPALIAVLGPTGVGKSALALELAQIFDGEIISADSRQVYRGLEVGSAQPSTADRMRVVHHLVDSLNPDETFSAAQFVDAAQAALRSIAERGRVALLVGGTYHYVQALLDGLRLPRIPPSWSEREALERLAAERGPDILHARLARLDPSAAAEIPPANVRRVIRALEVIQGTGQPFSTAGRQRGESRPALRLAITMPRDQLYERIDRRVDDMLASGWLDEARALLEAGYDTTLPAMTSTGYRELISHLRGELPLDEAVRRVKYSTHAYVRRQYAWLRRDPRIEWLEQSQDLVEHAASRVRTHLAEQARQLSGATSAQLPPDED